MAHLYDFFKVRHFLPHFDEIVGEDDLDYTESSLKAASVIRIARLAVVEGKVLVGAIGQISDQRLQRIRQRLADWIVGS